MNIDMAALHAIEVDRGIPAGELIETIKSALLTAYRHTAGHQSDATIDLDRKTGEVKVLAREVDEDGQLISEWDDTPEGFGRVAATTARQVMLQRFRDAENEKIYGEFSAREGDIVAGVIQRDARANARGEVILRMVAKPNTPKASSRRPSRCPAKATNTATGRGAVLGVTRRRTRAADSTVPHPSEPGPQAVLARGARDRRRLGRHHGGRPESRAPVEDRGGIQGPWPQRQRRLHRADGPAGAQRDERTFRREDRHHRLRRGSGPFRGPCALAGQSDVGIGHRCQHQSGPSRGARFPAVVGDRQGGGQNARLAARLTGWRIDIRSDAEIPAEAQSVGESARDA